MMSVDPDNNATQDAYYEPTQQPDTQQQSINDNPATRVWGKAVSTNDNYAHIDLIGTNSILFGRKKHCNVYIENPAISGEHCSIRYDIQSDIAYLTDLSTNGTYIDGKKIGKNNTIVISNNTEFVLLKTNYEKISYIIYINNKNNNNTNGLLDTAEQELYSKYDIRHTIGSGTFAEVRLCINKHTGYKYALKKIDKNKFHQYHTSTRSDSLVDEMNILRTIEHPNIIKLYDTYDTQRYLYLILEYIDSGDLFDKIISLNGKGFNENIAKLLFCQLLDSVAYLHDMNIIHRDLKPENILLQSNNKYDYIIKLSDFGLSRILNDTRATAVTQCGTPQYLAPEVLDGNTYTKSVDIWSLGVILYILLSGRSPFSQEVNKMNQQIKQGKIEFSQKYFKNTSLNAQDLIRKCICVNPNTRINVQQIYQHEWINSGEFSYKRDRIAREINNDVSAAMNITSNSNNYNNVQNDSNGNNNNTTTNNTNSNTAMQMSPDVNKSKSLTTHKRKADAMHNNNQNDNTNNNNVSQTLNFDTATSPTTKRTAKHTNGHSNNYDLLNTTEVLNSDNKENNHRMTTSA